MFFFNDAAATEIYTLSLHDALPIWAVEHHGHEARAAAARLGDGVVDRPHVDVGARIEVAAGVGHLACDLVGRLGGGDRKSTRLNSSHANISYAVFCLKK